MSIRLIIDSASDLPLSYAEQNRMCFLPLPVTIGDRQYLSGVDITPQQFYELLIESDCLPVTSQISPFAFASAIRDALSDGDTPVILTLSSKLSGTYQSAVIAAGDFDEEVYIVDSKNVSLGLAVLIQYAQALIERGCTAKELVAALEAARERVRVLALLDTLEYLKKGGRISSAAAMVGGMLSIKPVVAVQNGAVELVGKARGSKQGNNLLSELIASGRGVDFSLPLALGYAGLSDSLLQKYIADSRPLWQDHVDEFTVLPIGAAIGTYTGPGAIGVAFFEKLG